MHVSVDKGKKKMDAIREIIATTVMEHAGVTLNITISAGVAGFPGHGGDADTMLTLADEALYEAKNGGAIGSPLHHRKRQTGHQTDRLNPELV